MLYLGDYKAGSTGVFLPFSTRNASNVAVTLVDGAVRVYANAGTTEISAGITLVTDFDGKTGMHMVFVDLTNVAYAAGYDYSIVLSAGTVAGTDVGNTPLAVFSVENRANPPVNVSHWGGTPVADAAVRANAIQWAGEAVADAEVRTNVVEWGGTAVASANVRANLVQVDGEAATADAPVAFPAAIGTSNYAGADPTGLTTLLNRIPGVVQPQTGDSFARIGAPTGASLAADVAAGRAAVEVLAETLVLCDGGTVAGSPSPTTTTLSAAAADTLRPTPGLYVGSWLLFTTGTLSRARRRVAGHTFAAGAHVFTLEAGFPSAPAAGDTFLLV